MANSNFSVLDSRKRGPAPCRKFEFATVLSDLRAENLDLHLAKSMKKFNRQTGASGEGIAAGYLQKKGYTILERNFRNKFGEIDIIAKDNGTLVFVEVKSKTGTDFGSPEEMIHAGKLNRVRRMATVYMNGELVSCRIDVVAVVLNGDEEVVRLTHYENVY